MSLKVKESGGSFTPCPAGTHLAVCVSIYDLGTQQTPFKDEKTGDTKYAKQVFVQWELPDEKAEDGYPFVIGKFYTASLNEKANLRHDLEAWRGREFTADELEGFELKGILGKGCMLSVIHYPKADKSTGSKIGSVMALPKGTKTPKPSRTLVVFDIDEWDETVYRSLDEYWQKTIAASSEAKARGTKPASATTPANAGTVEDDSLPF